MQWLLQLVGLGFEFGWFIAAATLVHANEGRHVLV
jgi:hypothetical protein